MLSGKALGVKTTRVVLVVNGQLPSEHSLLEYGQGVLYVQLSEVFRALAGSSNRDGAFCFRPLSMASIGQAMSRARSRRLRPFCFRPFCFSLLLRLTEKMALGRGRN
ncbi:MAG: hypothetical protein DDT20_00620 [Firmicutes bacterium]|nr:hypothetical protein [Bacillota bacterium]